MRALAEELAPIIGWSATCRALGLARSSVYRLRQAPVQPDAPAQCDEVKELSLPAPSPRALGEEERSTVLNILNSERFQDQAPREVYATLLDEGVYLCSWSTMYRILAHENQVQERRNQLCHPTYVKPELLASAPNQVWSWDITKLCGPATWTYYYLYVIVDIFSRYVVGWLIAEHESAELAQELISQTCAKHHIAPDQLTLHADNGGPMIAKTLGQLLCDLEVAKSHSRPHVPNDNPYSEAQFKTLKYRPDYPDRFQGQEQARSWARTFFHWYNHEHHHTGINLLTPAVVHYGQASEILAQRQAVLLEAYQAHPERFVRGVPQAGTLPQEVWINQPVVENKDSVAEPDQNESARV
jgi:putative transposase